MPPSSPRPARVLAAALAAALGCADPAPPAYTRLREPAPRVEGLPAGATLVVFWAAWCPPCREELPALAALARDPPGGLAVVTFGEDEDEAEARAVFGGAPPPELRYRPDPGQRVAKAFGVDALPAAFVVAGGRLVARFDGPRDWESRGMRRLLARLASEASTAAAQEARPGIDGPRGAR